MAKVAVKKGTAKQFSTLNWSMPFTRKNWIIIFSGIGLLVLGYALMATSITKDPANNDGVWNNSLAVSVAPVILTIAYCLVIPFGIMYREQEGNGSEAA